MPPLTPSPIHAASPANRQRIGPRTVKQLKSPQSWMETNPSGQKAFYLSISLFTVLQYGKSVKTFSVEIQRIGVIQNKVLILNICEELNVIVSTKF